jgi:hypothetical protein
MTVSKETTLSAALVNVDDFLHSIEGINRSSFSYDGDRIKALAAAYALVSHLETPWDTVARLCMTEVCNEGKFLVPITSTGTLFTNSLSASLLWEHR